MRMRWATIGVGLLIALSGHAQSGVDELDAAARQAFRRGDYKQAAKLAKQLYDIRRAAVPPDAFAIATAALNTGMALRLAGQPGSAVQYFEIACEGAVAKWGAVHEGVGSCLLELANALADAHQTARAKQTMARALQMIETTATPQRYATGVFHAGEIFRDANEPATASDYFQKAAALYEPSNLNEPDFVVTALTESGQELYKEKRYAEAATMLDRAVRLQETRPNPLSAASISRIYLLADCDRQTGDYDEALGLLSRVATALTGVTSPGHIGTSDILLQIAELQYKSGGSSETLAVLQTLLAPSDGPQTNDEQALRLAALDLAGRVYTGLHEYDNAESSFRTALSEARATVGDIAAASSALGFYLLRRGRYAESRALFDDALTRTEKAKGRDSEDVADLLQRIAVGLINQGDRETARPVVERARSIYSKRAPNSKSMMQVLQLAAFCARNEADRSVLETRALALQRRLDGETSVEYRIAAAAHDKREGRLSAALATVDEVLAPDPENRTALELRATILDDLGRYKEAADIEHRVITATAASYGDDSVNVGARWFNLGRTALRSNDEAAARYAFLAAATRVGNHAQRLFAQISLGEQQQMLSEQTAVEVSAILSVCQNDPCLVDGYRLMIPWKGLVIDGLRHQSELTRSMRARAADPAVKRLKTLRTQLALWTSSRDAHTEDEWKKKNDWLTAEKEALERTLLASSSSAAEPNITLDALQGALHDAEVLVDVYRFDKFSAARSSPATYAAVMTGKTAAPRVAVLGLAKPIDEAVTRWLAAVDAGGGDTEWKALSARVWDPIVRALPQSTRRIHVSPDAELVRIPWHTLTSRAAEVVEVDSARSLVSSRSDRSSSAGDHVLIVGGVDYDAGRTPRSPGQPAMPFRPLSFANAESKAIEDLARADGMIPIRLADAAATKTAVLNDARNSSYLHFATHGFVSGITGDITGPSRTPLVDSGLALAGANVKDPSTFQSMGVLTAEEILDADMTAARLVILSACNTGLGVMAPGQGVLGLRSSLHAAGARKLVLSLWPVDDEATDLLMSTFYRKLWHEKRPLLSAFHEAQDVVRHDARFHAQKYWAGWAVVDPE